jgi:type II secretory pathway pseudopilin PulG
MATVRTKSLLIVLLAAIVLIGASVAMALRLMNTAPAWARRRGSTDAQTQHADQRLLDAVNWTADAQRRRIMPPAAAAQLPRLAPLSITFSQDDLDAFFDQCNAQFGWIDDSGSPDSPSAGVVLEDDRLILAVTPADGGSVFSVQFRPKLVDGKLIVPVVRVQKGMLPVPAALWHAWRDEMVGQLKKQLPAAAAHAAIQADGSANDALIQAQTSRLLIDALQGRPAEPIVFFPYLQDFRRHFLPVRLSRIDIADHAVSLSALPLNRDEATALVEHVRDRTP